MKHPNHADVAFEEPASAPESSFGDILNQYEQQHKEGEASQDIAGAVVSVSDESVLVDIGRKTEGILPADKVRDANGNVYLKPGDRIQVNIFGRNAEGYYELSTIKIVRPVDWEGLEAAFAESRVVSGMVVETVKGGLRIDVGVRAFLPASRSGIREVAELEKLVGQQIECRITKLDKDSEDVVVDRRVVLEEAEKHKREEAFGRIQEGMVITGKVRNLMDFGAFIDLGGVDGLLHVTDISWTRVAKPSDVLTAGEDVEVKVLKVNPQTRKISLGRKQLQPDPWTLAAASYNPGDRVRGKVERLADFGAFVSLAPGVDGLIHVSEMSWTKKVRKPSDVLQTGEEVDVVVLGVNPGEKRISLGLKQALGDPWETVESRFPAGSVVEGTITNLANFGAFVDLGDGFEGMIHVGDITREKRLDHPREVLKAGEAVKAAVQEIDRGKRRIRLSMKQLEPTRTDEFIASHQPGDAVTGRIIEVKGDRARVELGDGVFAMCRLKQEGGPEQKSGASSSKVDLSAMTAMLSAKWKQGGGESSSAPDPNALRPGQVRSFRIASVDPGQKRIDLDLAK